MEVCAKTEEFGPGGGGSVPACWDGHPLARQGKGGLALGISLRNIKTLIRGGLVGVWMGVLPALGINAASVTSYLLEKQATKDPKEQESFGKGNFRGVLARGGIKGCLRNRRPDPYLYPRHSRLGQHSTAAGRLIVHGVRPGANFFKGDFPYVVFAGILIAQLGFFVVGMSTAKYWAKVIHLPTALLAPAIGVLALAWPWIIGFINWVRSRWQAAKET